MIVVLCSCTSLKFEKQAPPVDSSLPIIPSINIALVLGGGGAKGIGHVAVLEELEKAGIKPDLIVGCSAGAIVGALYASDPDTHHIKSLLLEKRREDILEISLKNLPLGLSKTTSLKEFLTNNIKAETYKDLKIPFIAVATNLEDGNLVAFGKGPIEPTVRASAAFPGVFLPVKLNGHYFVDGGVADPLPVQIAKKMGAKFIIAVDLKGDLSDSKPRNVLGLLKRCVEISYQHHSVMAASEADFIIKIPFKNIWTFEENQNQYIYDLSKETAIKVMPALKRKLQNKIYRKKKRSIE